MIAGALRSGGMRREALPQPRKMRRSLAQASLACVAAAQRDYADHLGPLQGLASRGR